MNDEVVLATYEPDGVPGVIVDLVMLRTDLEAVADGIAPPAVFHNVVLRVRKA